MPCFLAQQKMEAIRIQTWMLQAYMASRCGTVRDRHEITDSHNASIAYTNCVCTHWTSWSFMSSAPLYVPYAANIANPGSRYLLLQTLQSLPALVTTFSTMECFLLLSMLQASGHRPRCSTELLHFFGKKSSLDQKNTEFSPEAFQRFQSDWATWRANWSEVSLQCRVEVGKTFCSTKCEALQVGTEQHLRICRCTALKPQFS